MTTGRPLSVQLYSVRELLPRDRDGVLRRLATVLGAELVIVPSGIPADHVADPDGIARAAELLNALAQRAAAAPDALRVVELDTCAGDLFEALAKSRRYLASLA